MHRTACQFPDQETIDIAQQLTTRGAIACPIDMVKNPLEFGAARIRINLQACACGYHRLMACIAQDITEYRGTPALSDDGVMDGVARDLFPYNNCFTLIGNASRCSLGSCVIGLFHRSAAAVQGRTPKVLGVVFDPAELWKMLCEFCLVLGNCCHGVIKQDRTG